MTTSSEVVSSQVVKTDGFKSLLVWQRAMDLAEATYKITNSFPKHELYGLVSQLQRAASSVPANIAEGYGRGSAKDEQRFLSIAYGSLMEVETYLVLAERLSYISSDDYRRLHQIRVEVGRLIVGYRRSKSA